MKLHSFKISGFRKHFNTEIIFSDSTFLIGENNVGKSSVLKALEYFLSGQNAIPKNEYYSIYEGQVLPFVNEIIFLGEFRNLPHEAHNWRGFRGRIFEYEVEDGSDDTGLCIFYKKSFPYGGRVKIEMKSRQKIIKENFVSCTTLQEYIDNGLDEELLEQYLPQVDKNVRLNAANKRILETIDEIYNFEDGTEEWDENPGGIQGNVLVYLPKFLLIPAQDKIDEITGSSGTLQKTLIQIFNDIKEKSPNYLKAQEYLELLAKELDPTDQDSDVSKMIYDINNVLESIFPKTGFSATADLSRADSLKPSFDVQMYSNIPTTADLQGTGLIRSAVFALLRYKNERDNRIQNAQDGTYTRPMIIGFEEPEIYLHPNAVYKMRDTIYDLAETRNNQIICTTHSPYMIDLSRKPKQILNNVFLVKEVATYSEKSEEIEQIRCSCFNTSKAFKELLEDDKTYVKMLLKVDDSIARVFFAPKVLIVEGDTEEIVLKETIKLLPRGLMLQIQSDWQIVRARGKATIIALSKYLKVMDIDLHIMHDLDSATPRAACFNQPIQNAVGDPNRITVCQECIEDLLGYPPPTSEKPYNAYKYIIENWSQWGDVPQLWKNNFEKIFTNGKIVVSDKVTTSV